MEAHWREVLRGCQGIAAGTPEPEYAAGQLTGAVKTGRREMELRVGDAAQQQDREALWGRSLTPAREGDISAAVAEEMAGVDLERRGARKTHPCISLTPANPVQKSHTREPFIHPLASHPISPTFQPPRHFATTASSTNLPTNWGTSQFSLTPSYATAPALSSPTFPTAIHEEGTGNGVIGKVVSFSHLPDCVVRLDSELGAGAGEREEKEAEERKRKRANRKRQLTPEEEFRFESIGFEGRVERPEPTINRVTNFHDAFFRRTWASLKGKLRRVKRSKAERKQNALIEAEERAAMEHDEVACYTSGHS
ncbi:hypothetical protein JHW43_005225 [Diplocarpon mali]|nr:hypothetical protein JHW43_005225 [Diplocarpon mali]